MSPIPPVPPQGGPASPGKVRPMSGGGGLPKAPPATGGGGAPSPSGARAPQFIGPTPGGPVQMSLQQHAEAILAAFKSRPPTPQDIDIMSQLFDQFTAVVAEEGGEQPGMQDEGAAEQQGMPGGPASSLAGPEQDYGMTPGAGPANLGIGYGH